MGLMHRMASYYHVHHVIRYPAAYIPHPSASLLTQCYGGLRSVSCRAISCKTPTLTYLCLCLSVV